MTDGHDYDLDNSRPASAEGELRRRSMRAQGRQRFGVFIVATLLLFGHMTILGANRVALTSQLGETGFLWIFFLGAFAWLLVPMIACEPFIARDRLLYCPHCGEYLVGIRSLHRLNTKGECRCCGKKLPIAKASRSQVAFDMAFTFAGLGLLVLALWLIG